jgi:ABC-type lipoprotein export system ATPase subunit
VADQDWDESESARVKMRRQLIGFVFQEFFLLPQLTALENVMLPHLFTKKSDRRYAEGLLEQVGLGARLHHRPGELSGGEMQRTAIARALANRPKLLLADEPTGNLDTRNSRLIFELFRTLSREQNLTVVVATHNVKLAQTADRIIYLSDGRIEREAKGAAA